MAAGYLAALQDHRNLIALFYVGSAGDNLNETVADIHLADNQFVRIRVLLDFGNLAYHNLLQIFVETLKSLYFCA